SRPLRRLAELPAPQAQGWRQVQRRLPSLPPARSLVVTAHDTYRAPLCPDPRARSGRRTRWTASSLAPPCPAVTLPGARVWSYFFATPPSLACSPSIVLAELIPSPYPPPCSLATLITASYVSWRAQSRCHSSITWSQVMGTAPAWIRRWTAISWASFVTPARASVTKSTSYPSSRAAQA